MKKITKKAELDTRFKENPFLEKFEINYKSKQVKVSAIGKDDNIMINQSTGEVTGTHLVTYKKVDSAEFIKLFAKNIALTFDLTAAGFKTLMVLAWVLQHKGIDRDKVTLDSYTFNDFIEGHINNDPPIKNFSIQTFQRGLRELIASKILAKAMRPGDYFINPNFVFNGNRIAFSTVIEKVSAEEADQLNLEM